MSWFKLKNRLKTKQSPASSFIKEDSNSVTVTELLEKARQSDDFSHYQLVTPKKKVWLSFYKTLIDKKQLEELLIKDLQQNDFNSLHEMKSFLTVEPNQITTSGNEAKDALMRGSVIVQLEEKDEKCIFISIPVDNGRDISLPEVEFTVIGPKESFVEDINVNINLVRKRLPITELQIKEIVVGSLTKTRVAVLYIDTIANDENVNTMIQRVSDIQYDSIVDSSFIKQMIEDQSWSPFPKYIETERPDRVTAELSEGHILLIVDGSPQAVSGPTPLVEFFSTAEDYFMGWHVASFLRLIRLFAVAFSIFMTPLYVAILTFHLEILPQDLLGTVIISRSGIPFPPIIEALILELTIELLREAGARLPTKVGQTIGIVGGIVIGTASVEASLTSNVLLILVALAALASFTTPVYRMGNTIRLLRFPFIIAAQIWGLISLTLLFCLMLVHLLSVTSLGRPYLAPLYPPNMADFKDSFFRLPFAFQTKRPHFTKTKNNVRFRDTNKKKKKDIDEGI